MTPNLPATLDQGLVEPDGSGLTAILVRQARSRLERVQLPCGFPGCQCDPDYREEFFCDNC